MPPFSWYGGKSKVATSIVRMFPPHRTYVEPFCGCASVFFAKAQSPVEVLNDLDNGIYTFFKVLRDDEQALQLAKALVLTPYSRQEFDDARDVWKYHPEKLESLSDIERARRWYVMTQQGYGRLATGMAWGYDITASATGVASTSVLTWTRRVNRLKACSKRLRYALIEHDDYKAVMERYDTLNTLFYLDPPYIASGDSKDVDGVKDVSRGYVHRFDSRAHKDFLDFIMARQGMILLSGYENEIYQRLDRAGWLRVQRQVVSTTSIIKRANVKKRRRTECVWLNPQAVERWKKFQAAQKGRKK
jgi:DNA adenine methylase